MSFLLAFFFLFPSFLLIYHGPRRFSTLPMGCWCVGSRIITK